MKKYRNEPETQPRLVSEKIQDLLIFSDPILHAHIVIG